MSCLSGVISLAWLVGILRGCVAASECRVGLPHVEGPAPSARGEAARAGHHTAFPRGAAERTPSVDRCPLRQPTHLGCAKLLRLGSRSSYFAFWRSSQQTGGCANDRQLKARLPANLLQTPLHHCIGNVPTIPRKQKQDAVSSIRRWDAMNRPISGKCGLSLY